MGTTQTEEIRALQERADTGDANAQYELGLLYIEEHPTLQEKVLDCEKAEHWFMCAAQGGNTDAQCKIGWIYWVGMGVAMDNEVAAKWLTIAAKKDHALAQFYLGEMYFHGDDGEDSGSTFKKDLDMALYCYRRAAQSLDPDYKMISRNQRWMPPCQEA